MVGLTITYVNRKRGFQRAFYRQLVASGMPQAAAKELTDIYPPSLRDMMKMLH